MPVGSTGNVRAVGRPKPALLDEAHEPEPDELARRTPLPRFRFRRVPAEPRQRLVEQQRIVAGIVADLVAEHRQRPLERHLLFRDQVAPPHLDPAKSRAGAAIASISRSRTKLVSNRPGAR